MIVTAALADIAGDVDVGKEAHFDALLAVALAGFAASALDVEAESAGLVAAFPRFGQQRKKVADWGERAGIGGRIGARRAADRRLVDANDFVDLVGALEGA